jgi:hypothetical protein
MRARFYDASGARFLSPDPVRLLDPRAINPYQYALANPVRFADPRGTTPQPQQGDVARLIYESNRASFLLYRLFDSLSKVDTTVFLYAAAGLVYPDLVAEFFENADTDAFQQQLAENDHVTSYYDEYGRLVEIRSREDLRRFDEFILQQIQKESALTYIAPEPGSPSDDLPLVLS